MSFWIKDEQFFKKCKKTWQKSNNSINKDLIVNHSTMKMKPIQVFMIYFKFSSLRLSISNIH